MQHSSEHSHAALAKVPWNKGKIIGAKPPLQTKHVWSIRLRGCDVVRVKAEDIAPRGPTTDRASVRQRKTGHPVKFDPTEQGREALDAYLKARPKHLNDYLFESRGQPDRCISTRQSSWFRAG